MALHAMGTRFELAAHGSPEATFRAAAEEAFEEIRRLEGLLSLYRETSDVGRLNGNAGRPEPIRIHPLTARLLTLSRELSRATGSAFDPTAGALVRAWGFHGADGHRPDPRFLEECRSRVGWDLLDLEADTPSARWLREGCLLDLGSVAKGFALDRAAELLTEAGLGDFLLHGGTSSVVGRGLAPDGAAWRVALPSDPDAGGGQETVVALADGSLSYSAARGRSFVEAGRRQGHIVDPRTGNPVTARVAAAVGGPSAAVTDALSTAVMVAGHGLAVRIGELFPGYRTLRVDELADGPA